MPGLDPGWSRLVVVVGADRVSRTWHVLDNGTPDPVGTLLCVHGNPTWSYLWRGLLSAAPPGWRVIAPDQLGMGYSERLTAPRNLAERVADLRALTETLDVAGPVVTVGHDWGGAVSLGWALAAGTQLRAVVLANTAVAQPPGDHGPALIRLANLSVLRDAVCVRTPTFVRAATALSRPALPAGIRDALAAPYGSASRRRSVGDFVADIPFAAGHPSRQALEAIAAGVASLDVPALLLWGPRDPVFGQRYLRDLLQRLPHADLHRYEGASHLLPEDAPEYAAAVARWVADLGAEPDDAPHESTRPRWASSTTPEGPTPELASRHTLWAALERRTDDPSPAVVEVGGARVSWEALARRVRGLAAGLAAAGVRPGHRVALLVPPSAE
ncbi:MAG: alpha/beta fold hydrolase, partial [Humibacillus sp.]